MDFISSKFDERVLLCKERETVKFDKIVLHTESRTTPRLRCHFQIRKSSHTHSYSHARMNLKRQNRGLTRCSAGCFIQKSGKICIIKSLAARVPVLLSVKAHVSAFAFFGRCFYRSQSIFTRVDLLLLLSR